MKAFKIQNFKFGLDRREQLTSQPGTLLTAQDGEITPGGEFLKRKAFALDQNLSILDTNGDAGTFGLETTSAGRTVFGSALPFTAGYTTANGVASKFAGLFDTPSVSGGYNATFNITAVNGLITAATVNAGGTNYTAGDKLILYQGTFGGAISGAIVQVSVTAGAVVNPITVVDSHFQQQPVLVSAIPAGYTYTQLKHPALTDTFALDAYQGANRITYDRAKHRITALPFSNNYNGNSFVAATFADGNTFLYYNGTFIRQSHSGVLWNSFTGSVTKTNRYIAYQVGKQFTDLSGWSSGTAVVDPVNEPDANLVTTGIGCPGATSTFSMNLTLSSTIADMNTVVGLTSTTVSASGNPTTTFTISAGNLKVYKVYAPILSGFGGYGNVTSQISGRNYTSIMSPESITGGAVDATTAGAIVTAINLLSTVTGYSASNGGTATVTVTAPIPSSPLIGLYSPIAFDPATRTLAGVTPPAPLEVYTDGVNTNHNWTVLAYTNAFGQRGNVNVYGTDWVAGDTWTLAINNSVQGNITIGKGNISGQPFINAMKLGSREFLAFGSTVAFSALISTTSTTLAENLGGGDPTGWEEQNIGAGTFSFASQYGAQDSVQAFTHLQGRLAVMGKQSIQMWSIDADPNNFALIQTLDNTGTIAPFSVQAVGDYDAYYLDSPGVRSLRAKEVTNNAFTDDVGIAIDQTIQAALVGYDPSTVCSIVEPTKRQYWVYINGTIYVLSNYPTSKVIAWSTFIPSYETSAIWMPVNDHYNASGLMTYNVALTAGARYTWTMGANDISLTVGSTVYTTTTTFVYDGTSSVSQQGLALQILTSALVRYSQTTFTPVKFVVYNKQVYVRDSNGKVYVYGGTDNNTYDGCQSVLELPYLAIGEGSTQLRGMGVDAALKGNWSVYANMQPKSGSSFVTVLDSKGSTTSPDVLVDSTYDSGHYPYSGYGTHFKLKAISGPYATAAKISGLTFLYDTGQTK